MVWLALGAAAGLGILWAALNLFVQWVTLD